ncbi:hypothetical protein AAHC03_01497 [Spirometra sp. Aus1]
MPSCASPAGATRWFLPVMVDELRLQQRRYGTLSESSRSDDYDDCIQHTLQSTLSEDGDSLPSFSQRPASKTEKSRKQNLRELREDFECDPELYGIRRSSRSRREPARFEPPKAAEYERQPRPRNRISSESDSSEDNSAESLRHGNVCRNHNGRASDRTRGIRVSYKSAFVDESDSNEEGETTTRRKRLSGSGCNSSLPTSRNQALLQRPKGSLIRLSGKTSDRAHILDEGKNTDTSDAESMSYAPRDNFSDDDGMESGASDSRQKQTEYLDVDEVDIIEEVLTHAIRRIGATGNPTTLYNCRMEHDPNEGFDPSKEKGELQFLIKWRSWSHIHSTWETEASLLSPERGCPVDGMKKLYSYRAAMTERQDREKRAEQDELDALVYEDERNELLLAEKMNVDRIVAHSRDKEQGSFDYLVKWRRLDYRYCTWESGRVINFLFKDSVEAYDKRLKSTALPNSKHEALRIRPKFVRLVEQPEYIGAGVEGLQLRDYQLKGLNWIAHAWTRGNSVILADEMGLGKTVQAVSFLSYLFHEHRLCGAFLLVVPLSTVCSWQRELELWAPQLNAITYTGDHISRQLIREHEWSTTSSGGGRRQQLLKFNVCITTYEILLKDKSWLSQVSWAVLVVDEAHRLKNDASQLYKSLFSFDTNTRLLITGTPLQNSLKELWSLLHFLMPSQFDDWDSFEAHYSLQNQDQNYGTNSYDAIRSLHRLLEPFLLRRVKKDVEQSLPAKTEQVLRVEMSKRQSTIYRLILARNYDGLMKVTHGHKTSFINIVMELKKCCNHANLIAPPKDSELLRMDREELLKTVLRGSGKLMLLDKLLLRLKPKGHRVLIFSQMVRMLDIIAEYLQLRGWSFQRLDGSIRGELRKQSLDHFNAEGSTDFCFLLSTRAGGLGINLATADTVIIFDSDWNPQNDIQAQARAHRIGQTKQVSVYRLVVKDSVEEKIIESATRKMLLDHLVIQRMESSGNRGPGRRFDSKGQLLTEILRHGAENLFKQCDEEGADVEVDIDDILRRAETRDADNTEDAYNPANALLSTFSVVTLDQLEPDEETKPVHIEQSGRSVVGKNWSEIIPSDLREQVKTENAKQSLLDLELGPRRRRQVKAYQAGLDNYNDSESSSDSERTTDEKPSSKFSDKEIRALVRAVKRFAHPLERIDTIAAEAELPDRTSNEVREVVESVLKGCRAAMEASLSRPSEELVDGNGKNKGPVYYYGNVAVSARPLLQSLNDLEILHKCLPPGSKEDRLNYELPFLPKLVNWTMPWDVKDDVRLLVGVYEHGYDNWEAIKLDADLGLGSKLLPLSATERPQASHIRTRVDYLLKMLTKKANKATIDGIGDHSRSHSLNLKAPCETESETKRRSKRSTAETRHVDSSRGSGLNPKSDEFVESDDTSSDSSDEPDLSAVITKPKASHRTLKRSRMTSLVNDAERSSIEVKKKKKTREKTSKPLHFTANREPVEISKEEEEEFHKMRGPLFDECKKKLYPVKKQLKLLEYFEDEDMTDSEQYDKAIMRIGDHISSLTKEMTHKHERHSWRGYFWEFVQNFSKKGPSELQHVYRSAIKRERKASEKEKRQKHPEEESADRSGHGKIRNTNFTPGNESEKSAADSGIRPYRQEFPPDKSVRHDGYHKRPSDARFDPYSRKSTDLRSHDSDRSRHGSDRHGDWSRRDRPHHRRSGDWSGQCGFNSDRRYDRFNNAFNRPAANFANQPPQMLNYGRRPPAFGNNEFTLPPPPPATGHLPFHPPWSHAPGPYSSLPAPVLQPPVSIIPPPIIPPPVDPTPSPPSLSRDPRLTSSTRQ